MTNTKFNPKVSIIIPVYNGANYVKCAIESALSQTYQNIEVIVVNDGSKDNTENICLEYGNKIKYIVKENGGVSTALNLGIDNMSGEYFSWLSHDDLYTPNKIQNQINYIKKNKCENSIVTSSYNFIDKNGTYLYSYQKNKNLKNIDYGMRYLINRGVHGCALLIPKQFFEKYGKFDEKLKTTQDYELWFRFFRNGELLYFIDEEDVLCRTHEEQGSVALIDYHVEECSELWIKIIKELPNKTMNLAYESKYDFIEKMYNFLVKETGYVGAINYIRTQYAKLIRENNIDEFLQSNYNIRYKKVKTNPNKKKILFGAFGEWQDRGGLNRVVANIANQLVTDYTPIIISTGEKTEGYQLDENIIYYDAPIISTHIIYEQEKALLLFEILEIDIYVSVYNCVYYFIDFLSKVNKTNIKTVAWNHEFYHLPYYNIKLNKVIENRNEVMANCDAVLWLTSASHKMYSFFGDNSLTMNNAVTVKVNQKEKPTKDNTICIAGRFDAELKNLEGAILLAKELKKTNTEFKLFVAGSYNLDMIGSITKIKLKDLIKQSGVEDNLIFEGQIDDIRKIYKKSRVNLMTSHHEGFGLTVIEAGSMGIPTVAFNDSGFEDMIENEETGYLVNRDDYVDMAVKVKRLFEDENEYDSFSKATSKNMDKFSNKKILNDWKNMLKAVENNTIKEYIKEKNKNEEKMSEVEIRNNFKEYERNIKKIMQSTNASNENKEIKNKYLRVLNEKGLKYCLKKGMQKISNKCKR